VVSPKIHFVRYAIPYMALLLLCACGDKTTQGTTAESDVVETGDSTDVETPPVPRELMDEAIALVNETRTALGLASLEEDAELSSACAQHARYMAVEGKLTHSEDLNSDWYTNEGSKTGVNALIAGPVATVTDAVHLWLLSVYHRISLLDPGVTTIGIAFEGNFVCMDILTEFKAQKEHSPVPYPTPNQENVPLAFTDYDGLSPLPNSEYKTPTGYIVTLLFPPDDLVGATFSGKLTNAKTGEEVEAFVRLPNDPNDKYAKFQGNAVSIMPMLPLQPTTEYQVDMSGTVSDVLYEKQWSFTTGPLPVPEQDTP